MLQQVRTDTVQVAIHATETLVRAGLVSFLHRDRRLAHVPLAGGGADVIAVAAETVDADTLELLRGLTADAAGPEPRFLLVVSRQWCVDSSAAASCGVRAALWRDDCTAAEFTRTLVTVARGGGNSLSFLRGTQTTRAQLSQTDVLTPHGRTVSPMSPREVDVLRLLAEGEELSEIAAKLCYSERTVKYVLYGLMKRLNLRNRSHAVSYAIRSGLI